MIGRMNNKKAIKAISIGLSIYMTLSPMVVYADELSEAESSVVAQIEVRDEVAASAAQAVENLVASEESQAVFENKVAGFDVSDISFENTMDDTSKLVEAEIGRIENEAVKEAAASIIDVDMTHVEDALEKVTELSNEAITDETVANEIEATADTLIAIYDLQAATALNALKVISEETNTVTVSDDGSVAVDWSAATKEVEGLYSAYQAALAAKGEAQTAKDQVAEKKDAEANKINELNNGAISNNEASEIISDSKLSKSDEINEIIASVTSNVKSEGKAITKGLTVDEKVDGSADMYRFYINIVEKNIAYGCLTYYDSASKTILRKNFKISADSIEYDYAPKAEWVKEDPNCKTVVFGNGGNYIAAYVGNNTRPYISSKKEFSGQDVSTLMRNNVNLNSAIDARNDALNELEKINMVLEDAEKKLQTASDEAAAALSKYENAVAMYKKAAALESEVKKNEVEKAKLEYVKAEVEVWRKQQALEQVKEAINNAATAEKEEIKVEKEEINNSEVQENIEAVVNSIANNLGAEPAAVESLVAQIIIDTEDSYVIETNNGKEAAVLGARRNKVVENAAIEEVAEVIEETALENTNAVTEAETVESANETLDEAYEVVTIEENKVALANVGANAGYSVNWWLPLIIALACAAWMILVIAKKNQKKEEANR